MSGSRLLRVSRLDQVSSCRTRVQVAPELQKAYLLQHVAQPITDFLLNKEIRVAKRGNFGRRRLTPFDRVQTYSNQYNEKCLLVDQSTAQRIAVTVLQHTAAGPDTVFYDGEGGLCHVAAEVAASRRFKRVIVLEKDFNLLDVHQFAREHILPSGVKVDFHPEEISLSFISKSALEHHEEQQPYISPLLSLIPPGSRWDSAQPAFTLVGTVTQGFIKYLTLRCLHRSQFSELRDCRPEFFFLMNARSFYHISCGVPSMEPADRPLTEKEIRQRVEQVPLYSLLMRNMNILFRLLFDFYLVDLVPRKSFIPWKPHQPFNKLKRKTKIRRMDDDYSEYQDSFLLVYARPKLQPDVDLSNPHYLEFFLSALLQNRSARVVPIVEQWLEGAGLHLIHSGHNIFSRVADLNSGDFVGLFNYITGHPHLAASSFVAEAETYQKYANSGNYRDRSRPVTKAPAA